MNYPIVITAETDCTCCGDRFGSKYGMVIATCYRHDGEHLLCESCRETRSDSECEHPKEPRDTECYQGR